MTLNEGLYCQVNIPDRDTVLGGPSKLKNNYEKYTNINNSDIWLDTRLVNELGFYPYVENDAGAPGQQFNRTLSDFIIHTDHVSRDAIYTEWSQEQKDKAAPTLITVSQREARSLASQTEEVLRSNDARIDVGSPPIIPPDDLADVKTYLNSTYTAVDDSSAAPSEPPGAIRQGIEVSSERVDRAVIRRIRQTWNTPDDIYGLSYTLYTSIDATGMSVKIHDGTTEAYLYTMTLTETSLGSGVWYAETPSGSWGQHLSLKPWYYVLFKGEDISQMRYLALEDDEQVFDVRWLSDHLILDTTLVPE